MKKNFSSKGEGRSGEKSETRKTFPELDEIWPKKSQRLMKRHVRAFLGRQQLVHGENPSEFNTLSCSLGGGQGVAVGDGWGQDDGTQVERRWNTTGCHAVALRLGAHNVSGDSNTRYY